AEKYIPTPIRDPEKSPYMYAVRSFDINKPGTKVEDLKGGVLGGTIVEGKLQVGDKIEIKPGIKLEKTGKSEYESLCAHVVSLHTGGNSVEEASCGGLVAVGTLLDPALSKADGLTGNVVGKPNELPPSRNSLAIETTLFEHAVGTQALMKVEPIKQGESLVLNVGTAVTVGIVTKAKRDYFEIDLKKPICAKTESRVSLSRKIAGKWRLVGYGILK
ncbi:MAG: translation initiation factor IF-2 subunit gamma, partial [Candidatus Bathyarchaeota archaeon]